MCVYRRENKSDSSTHGECKTIVIHMRQEPHRFNGLWITVFFHYFTLCQWIKNFHAHKHHITICLFMTQHSGFQNQKTFFQKCEEKQNDRWRARKTGKGMRKSSFQPNDVSKWMATIADKNPIESHILNEIRWFFTKQSEIVKCVSAHICYCCLPISVLCIWVKCK